LIELKLLILVAAANTAPLVLKWLAGDRHFYALDGGGRLCDDRPLFGPSKTWAGLAAAILTCGTAAVLLALPVMVGVYAGIAAMLGDLGTSFVKRRLGLVSSAPAPGLDQLAEVVLPLLVLRRSLVFSWWDAAAVLVVFVFGELLLATLLHRLGLRDPPI
jgi:CDP-2,3-bis-(O-geranylgeranyl)-sn-glycerol synthase